MVFVRIFALLFKHYMTAIVKKTVILLELSN